MNTKGKWWVIGDEKMYELMNFLCNVGMILNKWIYQIVDLGLEIFMSNTVFEDTVGAVFGVATSLYSSLFASLGNMLFVIAIAVIFWNFVFKSPQEAIRQAVALVLVLFLNFGIYNHGEEYIKNVNTVFDEVEQVMVTAVTVPMFNADGSQVQVSAGNSDSVDIIRDTYFKLTMQQSFAMVNFGESVYDSRFDEFLYTEDQATGDSSEDAKKDLKDLVAKESKTNTYMTPDGTGDKMIISGYAVISNIFVGVPLLCLAVFKFLLKILILAMVFLLPIISILSIIPKFANSLTGALGKIMGVFFAGAFMTLAMFLFFFIMTLIDSSVITLAGGSSIISCVLAGVVKGIVVFFIIKARNQIISFVSGGHITHVPTVGSEMRRELRRNRRRERMGNNENNDDYDDNDDLENDGNDSDDDLRPVTSEEVRAAVESALDARDIGSSSESDDSDDLDDYDNTENHSDGGENDEDESLYEDELNESDLDDPMVVSVDNLDELTELDATENAEVDQVELDGLEPVETDNLESVELDDLEPVETDNLESNELDNLEPVELDDSESIETDDREREELYNLGPIELENVDQDNLAAVEVDELPPIDMDQLEIAELEELEIQEGQLSGNRDNEGVVPDTEYEGSGEITPQTVTNQETGEEIPVNRWNESHKQDSLIANGGNGTDTRVSVAPNESQVIPEHEKFMQRLQELRDQD